MWANIFAQNGIFSLSSSIWQKIWIKAGYGFKAWYGCSWLCCVYTQFYGQDTTACCCIKESNDSAVRLHPLSSSILLALKSCSTPLPVIQPSLYLNWQKTPFWLCLCFFFSGLKTEKNTMFKFPFYCLNYSYLFLFYCCFNDYYLYLFIFLFII